MTADEILQERVRIVVHEVRLNRVAHDRAAVWDYVDNAFTLDTAAKAGICEQVMAELGPPPQQPKEKKMDQPKNVLRGKALRAAAAEVVRESPQLTAAEVYDELLARGHRVAMKKGSFAAEMTAVRKMVGANGSMPKPKAAAAPKRPAARSPVPARRATTSPPPTPAGTGNGASPSSDPIQAPRFTDGDRILIQRGDDRMDAQREDGQWHVELDATVDDGMVGRMLSRLIGVGS